MRILIDITPYCDNTDSRDSMIQTLADVLSVACNEEAADKEAYLAVDALDDTCAVFGMDNPEAILCAAQEWNKQIQADLRAAITEFTKTLDVFSAACDTRASLDTSATYNLKKAAMAADNDFYSFAEYALYIPNAKNGALYFRTVLEAEDLQCIQSFPKKYAIIEIEAK